MDELLTEEGYRVIVATDAGKAYRIVRDQKPDLVILDIPVTEPNSAWTILNMIQMNPETQNTPVIVCSTQVHSMHEILSHLKAMGCETIAKPFHLKDMLVKIRKLLGDRSTS